MKKPYYLSSAPLIAFFALALILVVAVPAALAGSFTDVDDTAWYADPVEELADQGVLTGYADGRFDPEGTLTRAQAVKLIVLGLLEDSLDEAGEPDWSYDDVFPSAWYAPYVEAAQRVGLLDSAEEFNPGGSVDRATFVKLLIVALGLEDMTAPVGAYFSDLVIGDWYYDYVQTATSAGLVGGYTDSTFQPGRLISRAEAAKLIVAGQDYQAGYGAYYWDTEEEPDENSVVFANCGTDFSCFVEAAEICSGAGVTFDADAELLETVVYNATLYFEILGTNDNDQCELYSVYQSIDAEYTDTYVADQLAEGVTQGQLDAELEELNADLDAEDEGSGSICAFYGDELYDSISEWDAENISLYDFDDFEGADCEEI